MLYQADGEFGTETIEADTLYDAASKVAKAHAGLDNDEICRDPFFFTVASLESPNNTREFQAQWSSSGGLEVYDCASGDLVDDDPHPNSISIYDLNDPPTNIFLTIKTTNLYLHTNLYHSRRLYNPNNDALPSKAINYIYDLNDPTSITELEKDIQELTAIK